MKTRRLDPDEAREAFKRFWKLAVPFIIKRARELEREFLPREEAVTRAGEEARERFAEAWRECENLRAQIREGRRILEQKRARFSEEYEDLSGEEALDRIAAFNAEEARLKGAEKAWNDTLSVALERIDKGLAQAAETEGDAAKTRDGGIRTAPRGVTLRAVAEILQNGDSEGAQEMLKRWNKARLTKPKPLGKAPANRRAYLYAPTAIVEWAEKIEGYLTIPKPLLIKRLMILAVEAEPE